MGRQVALVSAQCPPEDDPPRSSPSDLLFDVLLKEELCTLKPVTAASQVEAQVATVMDRYTQCQEQRTQPKVLLPNRSLESRCAAIVDVPLCISLPRGPEKGCIGTSMQCQDGEEEKQVGQRQYAGPVHAGNVGE